MCPHISFGLYASYKYLFFLASHILLPFKDWLLRNLLLSQLYGVKGERTYASFQCTNSMGLEMGYMDAFANLQGRE